MTKDSLPNSIPSCLLKYNKKNLTFRRVVDQISSRFKSEIQNDGRKINSLKDNSIIFIHYKMSTAENDFGRLLIVMVDKKSGFDFNNVVLTPKKLSPIDTEALRQAALFDLTLFDVVYPGNDGESYVKFIKGKSRSEFFKDALGCRKDVDNKKSIEEIFKALYKFAEDTDLPIPIRDKIEGSLRELLIKKAKHKNDRSLTLNDIQKEMDKVIPDDHSAKGRFSAYVNENEYEIDEVFEPTSYAANNSNLFEVKDLNNNYSYHVRKSAIGEESSGKPVILDRENKCLIFPLSEADFIKINAVVPREIQ